MAFIGRGNAGSATALPVLYPSALAGRTFATMGIDMGATAREVTNNLLCADVVPADGSMVTADGDQQ